MNDQQTITGSFHSLTETWQSKINSTREYIASLLNNPILSDVIFIVGDHEDGGKKFFAHKFILCGRSAVFDDMFNGPNAIHTKEVEIQDVDPLGFFVFLKYIYCDKSELTSSNVIATVHIAKKYDVPALEALCQEYLIKSFRDVNVFQRLTEAHYFGLEQLSAECLEHIDSHTTETFVTASFLDIDLDVLCAVLERDSLNIAETKLFEAVMLWSERKCEEQKLELTPGNQRQVLGKALKLIRFPLMSLEEFAAGPVRSGILCPEEAVEIFQYLILTGTPKPATTFIKRPRMYTTRFSYNDEEEEDEEGVY